MQLVKVRLGGALGQMFAREVELMANSPAMIIKGLKANFGVEFTRYIKEKSFYLLRIKPGDVTDYGEDELEEPIGNHTFVMCPVPAVGGGFFKVVAGLALVALAVMVPGIGTAVALMGASLALTGVAELLTPTPSTPEGDSERLDSYLSDRAARTSDYKKPIPVQIGRRWIREPIILSSGITTEQIA